jgi:hypothetical protein
MTSGAGCTVSVNCCRTVCAGFSASAARTEKGHVPLLAGVPAMVPLALSVRLPGSVPPASAQVYGPVPPTGASCWLWAVPAITAGRDVVVTDSGDVASVWTVASCGVPALTAGVPVAADADPAAARRAPGR